MNGRVYDPLLARFGTPDPMTESPFSTQGWNRYSYVGNSPLNFTDPSGYCFMGCFWKSAFRHRQFLSPELDQPRPARRRCCLRADRDECGLRRGRHLGLALRAGFIAAVTAAAFYGVGELTGDLFSFDQGVLDPELGGHGTLGFMSEAHTFNMAGHALVGCGSAVASGSKCGPRTLSAGVGSFVGPMVGNAGFYGGLVITSTAGGLASVAGGGKFGNGALTAAYGYPFQSDGAQASASNEWPQPNRYGEDAKTPMSGDEAKRLLGLE